jgi:hypothetical protein
MNVMKVMISRKFLDAIEGHIYISGMNNGRKNQNLSVRKFMMAQAGFLCAIFILLQFFHSKSLSGEIPSHAF